MKLYSIYHEMDTSSLLEYFNQQDQEKTILRLLCEERNCSIPRLSSLTWISKATLSKYNARYTKGRFRPSTESRCFLTSRFLCFIGRTYAGTL